jgi:HAD superfamily hydrolase (TIGR01484 family)
VGGSDLVKAKEQLGEGYVDIVDYAFPENGLQGFHEGKEFHKMSFVGWLGEAKLKAFINFCLHYIADLDIPIKRGTFIEFRSGMLNVSPIGRNCSQQERCDFEVYDQTHKIRETFIAALKTAFPDLGLKYSIGGQISFDVFPEGWDKSYCLQHVLRISLLQCINVTSEPGAAVQGRGGQGNPLLWRQDVPWRQRLRDFRASIREGPHCDVARGHDGAAEAAVSARLRQLSKFRTTNPFCFRTPSQARYPAQCVRE